MRAALDNGPRLSHVFATRYRRPHPELAVSFRTLPYLALTRLLPDALWWLTFLAVAVGVFAVAVLEMAIGSR
jgi:hypothetical protein